jgi:hypothetical protein
MSNASTFSSLDNMNKPLNERTNYIINTFNYLLNNHHIGKLLEEKAVLKLLHNSFFFFSNLILYFKSFLVYYLLIPTVLYMEKAMVVQGDTVIYKINNNQQLPTFDGTRTNYNSESEDEDYTNDLKVLNDQQLKDHYYKVYLTRTENKLNTSPFNFSEVRKILESFRK